MFEINNRNSIMLTLTSMMMLVYVLFLLRDYQPVGYAINIYELLPLRFYLVLLFCYLSACVLTLGSRKEFAVPILGLLHIVVLAIPYMLGYFSAGGADGLSYVGFYLETANSGILSPSDISPATSLLASFLFLFSGINVNSVAFLLPVCFSFMFILGMFLFYRNFMSREKLLGVALLSSFVFYFGHFQSSNVPVHFFFSMVPLCLFGLRVFLSEKNRMMAVSLGLLLFLIPFYQPFIFIFLICFSLFLLISGRVYNPGLFGNFFKSGFLVGILSKRLLKLGIPLLFLSISFTLLVACMGMNSLLWGGFVISVSGWTPSFLLQGREFSPGDFEFVRFLSIYYARYIIPSIFIVIASIVIWKNRKRFCHHLIRRYPRFICLYIASFSLGLLFFLYFPNSFPADRFINLNFIIFAQVPLFAYSLYIIFLRKGSRIGFVAVILILSFMWTLGVFTCYPSPYTLKASETISYNEIRGLDWVHDNKAGYNVLDFNGEPLRYRGLSEVSGSSSMKTDRPEKCYIASFSWSEFLYPTESAYDAADEGPEEDRIMSGFSPSIFKVYDSLDIEIYRCEH